MRQCDFRPRVSILNLNIEIPKISKISIDSNVKFTRLDLVI